GPRLLAPGPRLLVPGLWPLTSDHHQLTSDFANMQAALVLLLAMAPAAGARVLAGAYRCRARLAADAGVAGVVQRVDRDVVRADVRPHVVRRPAQQRVDLPDAVLRIGLEMLRRRARRGLIAADGGDPGVRVAEHARQRLDLAQRAAAIRIAQPERVAVRGCLRLERQPGTDAANRDGVLRLEPAPEVVGLGKQQTGIEREELDRQPPPRGHVDQDAAFGAETGRQQHPGEVRR